MKKILHTFFLLCFCISGFSQTTLAIGDLSIIYYSPNPDEFGFVTFVDLDAGTLIYFDENGATAAGVMDTGEGILLYTVNTAITAGTIVSYSTSGVSGNGTWSSHAGSLGLSTSGDQIFIYQDTDGPGGATPQTNPSFIFGFNAASANLTDSCTVTDSNQTDSPSVLTPVTFGGPSGSYLAMGTGTGCQDENDFLYYNGSLNFTDFAAAKAAITDPDNWTGSTGVSQPTDYTTAVNAMNSAGSINTSVLSVDEANIGISSISLYPNPASDYVILNNPRNVSLSNVEVYEVTGRLIKTVNTNQNSTNEIKISIAELATGPYLISIQSENKKVMHQIIKK